MPLVRIEMIKGQSTEMGMELVMKNQEIILSKQIARKQLTAAVYLWYITPNRQGVG